MYFWTSAIDPYLTVIPTVDLFIYVAAFWRAVCDPVTWDPLSEKVSNSRLN